MRSSAAFMSCLFALFVFTGDLHAAGRQRAVRPIAPSRAPTSFDLIDAALSRGLIDRDTALLYKVYSTFDDPRLPQQFVGVDVHTDSLIMEEVISVFDQLSPDTQRLLAPFFIAPMYAGSWYELRHGGNSLHISAIEPGDCASSFIPWNVLPDPPNGPPYPVRVWWSPVGADRTKAEAIAAEVQNIWTRLSGIFRTPLGDGGGSGEHRTCRGGDDRPDVILVGIGETFETKVAADDLGIAVPFQPEKGGVCPVKAAKLLIRQELEGDKLWSTLAHELTHLFHYAYSHNDPCTNFNWLHEATAQWAEELPTGKNYRGSQLEHPYAKVFLDEPGLSLDFTNMAREYGAYLFPFYLSCTDDTCSNRSNERVISAIYENTLTMNSRKAVNDAIPGNFDKRWPAFTLLNWNTPPVDAYQKADAMPHRTFFLQLRPEPVREMFAEIKQLSARYFHGDFPDPNAIRSIAILNGAKFKLTKRETPLRPGSGEIVYVLEPPPDAAKVASAHIRTLARMDNVWVDAPDDVNWDNVPAAIYCQSSVKKSLDELLLVISNSEYRDEQPKLLQSPALPMTMLQSNYGCAAWAGTAKTTWLDEGLTVDWTLAFEQTIANGPFRTLPQLPGITGFPVAGVTYKLTGASFGDWKIAKNLGACSYSGSGRITPQASSYLTTHNFVPDGPLARTWEMQLNAITVPVTVCCPGQGCSTSQFPLPSLWIIRDIPLYPIPHVDATGTKLKETFSRFQGDATWSVDLTHQP